jgi:hypothetical protein
MDKSMLGDLDGLPEEDKMRMAAMIDQLQIRDRFVPYQRISWAEQGRSFVVWKPVELARDLLPLHFKHNNFSFVCQLNTYVSTSKTHSSIYTSSVLLVTEIVAAKQRYAFWFDLCVFCLCPMKLMEEKSLSTGGVRVAERACGRRVQKPSTTFQERAITPNHLGWESSDMQTRIPGNGI